MPASPRRRPSAALIVALLALFVALGGPAHAQRLLSSSDIRDRSIQTRDLSRKAVKTLRATPKRSIRDRQLRRGAVRTRALRDGAVTSVKLADSVVTPSKIAPSAVGAAQLGPNAVGQRELRPGAAGPLQIADGAVSGAKVADGTLDARDVTRFSGRFRITVPAVADHSCWSGEPVGLAPESARADISGDLVVVTPDASWPEDQLSFTVRNSANRSRFVLAGCNITRAATTPIEVGFRYAVIDIP